MVLAYLVEPSFSLPASYDFKGQPHNWIDLIDYLYLTVCNLLAYEHIYKLIN